MGRGEVEWQLVLWIDEADMSVVFLLGAGFSKAASGFMPVLEELSQELEAQSLVPPHAAALGGNVEDWLTYLSQPQPWNTEAENLRNKADFLDLTHAIGSVIRNREKQRDRDCPDWLKSLIRWWHHH